jgi:hypothetical protein
MPHQSHLARQAEAARHGAANLRRNAEGHRRGVGDEHCFDPFAVVQLQDEFPCAINRLLVADDGRSRQRELPRAESESLGRSVIRSKSVTPALEDPPVELAGVEARMPRLEFRSSSRSSRPARSGGGHAMSRIFCRCERLIVASG